jgi:hypothetical protein
MNAALAELEEQDVDGVLRWRFLVLKGAGYAVGDAVELATSSNVDLHVAVDLVGKGCPPHTAVRILK